MHVRVKKWGNSASVRLPAAILEAANLSIDQTVDIREENGRVVIEPVADPAVDLDALVDAITEENRHDEVSTGASVGAEAW
ncbi:AbrB/MazE/SpoVT family DNA-binding domain-containing protein [Methyloraptor flagellatus]|uniref:AbrB/MazE/SpoVT family DNA-binding domain-containing protein n=1 Tax=Methyloraptor flagellatus TaxID=3162530 RepID=A0AAU7XAW9_9HYPH